MGSIVTNGTYGVLFEAHYMNSISPKVSNGFGAAGGSTPVTVIVIWLIGLTGVVIPPEVAAAIASLVAALAGLAVGYWTPHDPLTAAALEAQKSNGAKP